MPVPGNIISQLVDVPHEPRLAQAYLGAVDLAENESVPWGGGNRQGGSRGGDNVPDVAFQYWPESLQDTRGSEWNPRSIPGGSHPIYQWTQGGERRLSFTALFSTDTEPEDEALLQDDPYAAAADRPLSGIQRGSRDLDIRAAVSWLRYYTYPMYGTGQDLRVFEPPKVLLVMPNSGIAYDGHDYVTAVMTQCDVTYQAWFPSGFPRMVEIQLEFAEVVQQGLRVSFHDRQNMRRSGTIASYLRRLPANGGNAR